MSERRSVARLNPGQPAPDFAARTKDGQIVRLSDFRGQIIWLIFYRYPGCPICNLHLSALTKRYSWIHNSKVKVITVFESPAELFPKSLAGQPYPPFPFIADPERRLYQLYQTECLSPASILRPRVAYKFFEALFHGKKQGKITGHLGQKPAHFLIAEDGILDVAFYGRDAADHIPWTTVDAYAQERQIGNWNPGKSVVL